MLQDESDFWPAVKNKPACKHIVWFPTWFRLLTREQKRGVHALNLHIVLIVFGALRANP